MGYIVNMLPRHLAAQGATVDFITMDIPHYFYSESQRSSYSNFDTYAVMRPNEQQTVDGFRLHCLGHRMIGGYPRFIGLQEKLESLAPDVVQSFLAIGWVALDAALLRERCRFRLFTAAHTTASVFPLATQPSSIFSPARVRNTLTRYIPGRFVSKRTERCYAATTDCADVAIRFFGVESEKVDVAPLGVDTDLLSPAVDEAARAARAALRASLGFADEELVYIYTGQFTDAKNPALLASAIADLRGHGHAVRALFLGGGPQEAKLREYPGSVVLPFVPHRELVNYYRCADVGVWPTQESTSMLDAAACGLPIIVNDTLRATERIEGNGITYRLGDKADLMRAIQALYDAPHRAKLGSTGARRMAELFSWRSIAQRRLVDFDRSMGNVYWKAR